MWKFFIFILILLQNHTSADEDSPIITEDQWEWLARRSDIYRPNHFDQTDTPKVPSKPQPVGPSVVTPTKPLPVGPRVEIPTKPHPVRPSVDTSNPNEVGPIPETKSDIVYFQYADSPKVPLANFDFNAGGRSNINNISVPKQFRRQISTLTPAQGQIAANDGHIYNQNAFNNSQPKVPLADWKFLGKQSNNETPNVVNFTNDGKFYSEENQHLPIRRQISVDLSQGRQLQHGLMSYEKVPSNRTETVRTAYIGGSSFNNPGVLGMPNSPVPSVPLAQWKRQTNVNEQQHSSNVQNDQGQTMFMSTNHQQYNVGPGTYNPNKTQDPVDISSVNIPANLHNGADIVVYSNINQSEAARDSLVKKTDKNCGNTTYAQAISPGLLPTVPLVKLDTPMKEPQLQSGYNYVNISRVLNSNGSVYLNIGNNLSVNISQVINTNGTLYLNIGNGSTVQLPNGTGRTILRNNSITHIPDYVANRTLRATVDVNSSVNRSNPSEDTLAKQTNEAYIFNNSIVKSLLHESIPVVPLAKWGNQSNVINLPQTNKTHVANATTRDEISSSNRNNLKHHVSLTDISNGNKANGTDRPLPSNRSMVNIPIYNPNLDRRPDVAVKINFNNSQDAENFVVKKTDNPNHHFRVRINCRCRIHGRCVQRESCEY